MDGVIRPGNEESTVDPSKELRQLTITVPDAEEHELALDYDALRPVGFPDGFWR